MCGTAETVYVPDLGDEHRRQHRPNAGQLLNRVIFRGGPVAAR